MFPDRADWPILDLVDLFDLVDSIVRFGEQTAQELSTGFHGSVGVNMTTTSLWSQTNGEVLVVYFSDAKILDDARIQQIGKDLTEMVSKAEAGKMLLNFQNVGFMSSAMIGKLILLSKKCKTDKVDLKFCNIAPNIMEVFKIMKLNKVFDIHPDESNAIKAYEKKGWFG